MLIFPTRETILAKGQWLDELSGGDTQIFPWQLRSPLETELNFEILRRVIFQRKPTKTGQLIWKIVKGCERPFYVIGWRSENLQLHFGKNFGALIPKTGYTCFSSDDPKPGVGTILINLDLMLEVQQEDGSGKDKIYDNALIILHELGHAKQFEEMPSIFNTFRDKHIIEGQGLTAPAEQTVAATYGPLPKMVAKSYTQLEVQKMMGPYGKLHRAFPCMIERDNYIRHEGPICDEWGLMRRGSYTNVKIRF
jgi:hypothetical protein